jgi:excisionase family DNA binding protein
MGMRKTRDLDKVEADKYLTVDEASDYLRVKPTVLRNYLSQDKLTTYKFKTLTLLSKAEIERWKSDRSR